MSLWLCRACNVVVYGPKCPECDGLTYRIPVSSAEHARELPHIRQTATQEGAQQQLRDQAEAHALDLADRDRQIENLTVTLKTMNRTFAAAKAEKDREIAAWTATDTANAATIAKLTAERDASNAQLAAIRKVVFNAPGYTFEVKP